MSQLDQAAARPLTIDTDEEALFRETVRQFAQREVAPHVREMDRAQHMDPAVLRGAFELGLMGIGIPTSFGGAGSTFTNAIIAIEELAVVDPSISVCVDVQNTLVNKALFSWGTDAQRHRYGPRLARDLLGSYCLSEPSSGSDAFALKLSLIHI